MKWLSKLHNLKSEGNVSETALKYLVTVFMNQLNYSFDCLNLIVLASNVKLKSLKRNQSQDVNKTVAYAADSVSNTTPRLGTRITFHTDFPIY